MGNSRVEEFLIVWKLPFTFGGAFRYNKIYKVTWFSKHNQNDVIARSGKSGFIISYESLEHFECLISTGRLILKQRN